MYRNKLKFNKSAFSFLHQLRPAAAAVAQLLLTAGYQLCNNRSILVTPARQAQSSKPDAAAWSSRMVQRDRERDGCPKQLHRLRFVISRLRFVIL